MTKVEQPASMDIEAEEILTAAQHELITRYGGVAVSHIRHLHPEGAGLRRERYVALTAILAAARQGMVSVSDLDGLEEIDEIVMHVLRQVKADAESRYNLLTVLDDPEDTSLPYKRLRGLLAREEALCNGLEDAINEARLRLARDKAASGR